MALARTLNPQRGGLPIRELSIEWTDLITEWKPSPELQGWLKQVKPTLRAKLRESFLAFLDKATPDELAASEAHTRLFPHVADCLDSVLAEIAPPGGVASRQVITSLLYLIAPSATEELKLSPDELPFSWDGTYRLTRGTFYLRLLKEARIPRSESVLETYLAADGNEEIGGREEVTFLNPGDYLKPEGLWDQVLHECNVASLKPKLPPDFPLRFVYVLRDLSAWSAFSDEVRTRLKRLKVSEAGGDPESPRTSVAEPRKRGRPSLFSDSRKFDALRVWASKGSRQKVAEALYGEQAARRDARLKDNIYSILGKFAKNHHSKVYEHFKTDSEVLNFLCRKYPDFAQSHPSKTE